MESKSGPPWHHSRTKRRYEAMGLRTRLTGGARNSKTPGPGIAGGGMVETFLERKLKMYQKENITPWRGRTRPSLGRDGAKSVRVASTPRRKTLTIPPPAAVGGASGGCVFGWI